MLDTNGSWNCPPSWGRALSKLVALVVLLGGVGLSAPAAAQQEQPNIIFIMADDLGYGDLGVYGQERIQTPNLDQMAQEGMRFTQFYAGNTVCAPSRSVLMTGQHTGHTYVRGNKEMWPMGQWPLPDEALTTAEVIKQAGYNTALAGKWGLGGPGTSGVPNKQGFDFFYGYLGQRHAHNYYPEYLFRNQKRIPLEGNEVPGNRPDGAGQATERAQYSHDLIMEEALDYVRRAAGEPFFLYLSPTLPHANNEAGDEGMEVPSYGQYADKDWPESQKGLAAMITRLDRDVGRLLDLLEERGIDDNTIVLFTSDNGPHAEGGNDPYFFDSNGPLRGIKRDFYDGGIRVPMIARWPGHIAPGTTTDHIAYFGDVMATAADLIGTQPPDNIDSISFLPTLLGHPENQTEHDYLYWEFFGRGSAQAVRMGPWKAVRQPIFSGDIELYNIENDIGEQNNVADENPDVVERIRQIMEKEHEPSPLWRAESGQM